MLAFYSPRRRKKSKYDLPGGTIYEPFHDAMRAWQDDMDTLPHRDVAITSFDGLTLRGKYYEFAPGAPMELMVHGYRGNARRDMCGGIYRCFSLGRSALVVDQRGSGESEGRILTFGVREYRDCLKWVDFAVETFGPDVKIVLTGISMGAATVTLAAGEKLPKNVVGVLADCGYSDNKAIICKVIRQLHLPPKVMYPFVKLGARLFGGFDLEAVSPEEALKHATVPVIFAHGEADDLVPCEMSRINYEACVSPKRLVTVPGAGHGLVYPTAPDTYLNALADFFTENGLPTKVQRDERGL